MNCSKCGHPTNHKTGICAACTIDNEFGQMSSPASRHYAKAKSIQGTEGGTLALSPSYSNKKLKRYARAQISYLLSLGYQGNMPNLIKRLHLLQRNLRNGKF